MLIDCILEGFGAGLLGCLGCVRVCQAEDVLGERQQRPFCVLRIGSHFLEGALLLGGVSTCLVVKEAEVWVNEGYG